MMSDEQTPENLEPEDIEQPNDETPESDSPKDEESVSNHYKPKLPS